MTLYAQCYTLNAKYSTLSEPPLQKPEHDFHRDESAHPVPEHEFHRDGSGIPKPKHEFHRVGSGKPEPEHEFHRVGSGKPEPEHEFHRDGWCNTYKMTVRSIEMLILTNADLYCRLTLFSYLCVPKLG